MNDPVCKCGHPKERHIYGERHCTVSTPNDIGVGKTLCLCKAYAKANPLYDALMNLIRRGRETSR